MSTAAAALWGLSAGIWLLVLFRWAIELDRAPDIPVITPTWNQIRGGVQAAIDHLPSRKDAPMTPNPTPYIPTDEEQPVVALARAEAQRQADEWLHDGGRTPTLTDYVTAGGSRWGFIAGVKWALGQLAARDARVRAEALRDAAEHAAEIDGRRDDAAADWLRARAASIEQEKPTALAEGGRT